MPCFLRLSIINWVPQEELSVTLQHPFRGGVSPLQPVQSTVLFHTAGGDEDFEGEEPLLAASSWEL